ncbi:tafazzin [Colletotrichum sojae]|uniref:Tafazzin n=1 Tax=Colletotrichum sojae TaxID=2175907 RepID=A0A8H6MZA7_9PEZI|nr:tafazzin [Colletotrichum sojae]
MPKKRHQSRYSKPQSTAPASLGASASASTSTQSQRKGVNELLADLRRSSPAVSGRVTPTASVATPSVPPSLREILRLPDTPLPAPRRVPRFDATGRRVPPGPPPPRSWLSSRQSSTYVYRAHADTARRPGGGPVEGLPGAYEPDKGSFADLLLRRMALNWEFHRDYDLHYLHALPSRVRSSLVRYVGAWYEGGLSASDLRIILIPPVVDEEDSQQQQVRREPEELVLLNNDIYSLDLAGSIGHSIRVKELTNVLFPQQLALASEEVQDSWDTAEAPSLPARLIPNLTHLCLAITPNVDGGSPGRGQGVSWRHLLALAAKLPTLTHLSLAYWPEPSLASNAKMTTVVLPDGRVRQEYAHGSEDKASDWSEAVILLRKLSKFLYGLEYLDLTGCGSWIKALMVTVDGDRVDWSGPWSKVSELKLTYGYELSVNTPIADGERFRQTVETAKALERYIIAQRAGKGRFINVDRDHIDSVWTAAVN